MTRVRFRPYHTRGFLSKMISLTILLFLTGGIVSCGNDSGNSSQSGSDYRNEFITVWNTKAEGGVTDDHQIRLPLNPDGEYNFTVDWGDGSTDQINSYNQAEVTHTYSESGEYTVTITGTLKGFGFAYLNKSNPTGDNGKLLKVLRWGQSKLHNNGYQFFKCINLTEFPNPEVETPDLEGITNMSCMFYGGEKFNEPLNHWDVSGVENMHALFYNAASFNQPLNSWDVSSVEDMSSMFNYATSFNQPLNEWDVSGVEDMSALFYNAASFNQPLNSWDVSSVEDMSSMFNYAASFNQLLNKWDVSGVENMHALFYNAASFNQPLNSWDVSSVEDMSSMFNRASDFNQDLSGWCVKQITTNPSNFSDSSPINGQGNLLPKWGEPCTE